VLPISALREYAREYGAFIRELPKGWYVLNDEHTAQEEHVELWARFADALEVEIGLVMTARELFTDYDTALGALYDGSLKSTPKTITKRRIYCNKGKSDKRMRADVPSPLECPQRFDVLGSLQWAKTFGGISDDAALSVQQTSDGGYIVAGYTYDVDVGYEDVFLIKTDASGNLQWAKTFGGSGWQGASSVQQTSDGGYIVAGGTWSFSAGNNDVFLLKTDASGNLQWAKTFGGGAWEEARSVQQTSDGGYIVAGYTYSFGAGSDNVFLLKTDASGNLQWAKTFGGSGWQGASSVQQTSDGGYIVAGYTGSFGAGDYDVFLLKTDASGNLQWAKTFRGDHWDYAYSVQQTSDGGYIVAGGTHSFGAGYEDVFLLKTDANGNIGTCAIVGSVTPTVNTPTTTETNPTPTETSPTINITTPSPTVTSPTLAVSEPCPLSISEGQRFDGCFADVVRVGKGHITVSSMGEFRVKIYDVSGNVVKDVEGKGVLRISLKKGVYFVEVVSKEIKRAERVIVR